MITVSNSVRRRRARGLEVVLAAVAVGAAGAVQAESVDPNHYFSVSGIYTKPDSSRGANYGLGAALAYAGRMSEELYWEGRVFTSILDTGTQTQIDYYQTGLGLDFLKTLGHPASGDFFVLGGAGAVSNSVSPSSKSGVSADFDVGAGWRAKAWTFWGLRPRVDLRYVYDTFDSGQSDITLGFTLEIPSRPERVVVTTIQTERVETVNVPVEVEKIVEKNNVCVVPAQKPPQ